MIPPSGHLEFYAGDTHVIAGQLLDENAQPVDISSPDDYILFTARRTPKSPIAIEYRADKIALAFFKTCIYTLRPIWPETALRLPSGRTHPATTEGFRIRRYM